eukprot:4996508-Prymnesium_polylepis.2
MSIALPTSKPSATLSAARVHVSAVRYTSMKSHSPSFSMSCVTYSVALCTFSRFWTADQTGSLSGASPEPGPREPA